jgi:hypothetical protein
MKLQTWLIPFAGPLVAPIDAGHAGYRRGLIQGRWADCDSQPTPSVRKVAVADVRKSLPPETPTVSPAEREKQIRDRRAALQERPLW